MAGAPAAGGAWNASVARRDVTSAHLFGADRAHVGAAGVWAGQGVTRTKPSRTLFIAGIPRGSDRGDIEGLFKGELGFSAVRAVGRMLFVDFVSEVYAIAAMRKHQGRAVGSGGDALLIDFDRDAGAAVRAKKRTQANEQEEAQRQANTLVPYYCMLCKSQRLFALAPIDGVMLMAMPKRSSGDYCVDEAKFLKHSDMLPLGGEPKLIKRAGGIERRFELVCPTCRLPVAYRPVPLEAPTQYLYVRPDAVCWSQSARVPAQRWAAEAHADERATQRRRLDAQQQQQEQQSRAGATAPAAAAGSGDGNNDDAAAEDDDYGASDPRAALAGVAAPVAAAAAAGAGATAPASLGAASAGAGLDGQPPPASSSSSSSSLAEGEDAGALASMAASAGTSSASGGGLDAWPAALRARAAAVLGSSPAGEPSAAAGAAPTGGTLA